MTYFPSITLGKAWPSLPPENQVDIQGQLGETFLVLKGLKREVGKGMGGIGGEGVQDWHMDSRED